MSKVEVKFYNKQLEAYRYLQDQTSNIIIYGGKKNAGKSWIAAYYLMINCMKYPNSRWGLCRATLKDLKTTSLNTFIKCCEFYGVKGYKINNNSSIIKFINGSEIHLIHLGYKPSDKEGHRFGGIEFSGVVIEELSDGISQKYFESMYLTIRHNLELYGITKKLFCTCNPSDNWIKTYFYDRYIKGTLEPNIKFIDTAKSINPFRDKYYNDGLKLLSEASYRRLELGDWDYSNSNDRLFTYDKLEEIFTGLEHGDSNHYISADIARFGEDSTVIIVWKGLVIVEIIQLFKSDTNATSEKILEKMREYNIVRNKVIVDSDGIGGGVVDRIRCIGFVNGGKSLKDEKFFNIKSQMYFKLSKTKWSISRSVKRDLEERIKKELSAVRDVSNENYYRINSKDEQKIILNGESPDFADAIMFRMYFEYKSKLGKIA